MSVQNYAINSAQRLTVWVLVCLITFSWKLQFYQFLPHISEIKYMLSQLSIHIKTLLLRNKYKINKIIAYI